jgi:large subunit ribosomal protein L13
MFDPGDRRARRPGRRVNDIEADRTDSEHIQGGRARSAPLGGDRRLRASARARGKHRSDFTPNQDTGDFVVVINAAKVRLTGKKADTKVYHRHSGYPGGIRTTTAASLLKARPERLVETAVRGMLPKNRLGRRLFTKLKVYAGPQHPHSAQKPVSLDI